MKRYTKKQLRELVAIGAARDLDKAHDDFVKAGGYMIRGLEVIARSRGVRGVNGLLLRSESGELFVTVSSLVFVYDRF